MIEILESWVPLAGWEGIYEVSDHGSIKRILKAQGTKNTGTIKIHTTWNGYSYCILCRYANKKHIAIHRAVAMSFIPNPLSKPEVNHKDGDKSNNRVDNLEWVTKSENGLHSYRMLGRKSGMIGRFNEHNKTSIAVMAFKDNTYIGRYPSAREAERQLKISHKSISKCLRGKANSAGDYVFKYAIYDGVYIDSVGSIF